MSHPQTLAQYNKKSKVIVHYDVLNPGANQNQTRSLRWCVVIFPMILAFNSPFLCMLVFVHGATGHRAANNEVSMGTTIMAAKFRGGVVVGADTRTSVSGTYVSNRFASKLSFVLEPASSTSLDTSTTSTKEHNESLSLGSTCCLCRSGSSADTQQLAFLVEQELFVREMIHMLPGTVTSAAHLTKSLLREHPDWSCGLICTGYDHLAKEGKIFSISPSGAILEEPLFSLGGSGSTFIAGHVESVLQDLAKSKKRHDTSSGGGKGTATATMSEEECVEFVGRAIELAMSSDNSSGGYVWLYVIDKYGARPMIRMPKRSLGRL